MFNIFLDLDNTLISAITQEEEEAKNLARMAYFRIVEMDNLYKIFERPGLQPFLDFLFKNFNVSVWTAADKLYASFIINNFVIMGKPERQLEYILFSEHCQIGNREKDTQKPLEILKEIFRLNLPNESILIIDDNPEVYNYQPDNCFLVKPFSFSDFNSENDDELNAVVKPFLEKLII